MVDKALSRIWTHILLVMKHALYLFCNNHCLSQLWRGEKFVQVSSFVWPRFCISLDFRFFPFFFAHPRFVDFCFFLFLLVRWLLIFLLGFWAPWWQTIFQTILVYTCLLFGSTRKKTVNNESNGHRKKLTTIRGKCFWKDVRQV